MTTTTTAGDSPNGRPRDNQTPPGLPLSMVGGHNPWIIALVVSLATFMEVLDTSIANVALSHIAGNLAASLDESTWVLTSYLVSNAVVLPISGWLATVIERKRFYMGCSAGWPLADLADHLSGIAGGGWRRPPAERAIDPRRHVSAGQAGDGLRPVRGGSGGRPAVGPTLGGWITDNYSWHWVFLINVPVGLVSLCLTSTLLATPAAEERRRWDILRRGLRIDYIGFGLVALGLGCLQIVLDKGEREDWFASTFIVVFTVISAVALVMLIVRELTHADPSSICRC
jgi:MFS transporter, DHA2 family, multidrug resistance protein